MAIRGLIPIKKMVNDILKVKCGKAYALKLKAMEDISFSEPWSLNSIESLLLDSNTIALTYELNEKMLGYVLGRRSFDECELYRIAVLPNSRKEGIGNILMTEFCKKCARLEIKSIFLEVAKNNLPAVLMYKKFGFQVIAVRKNYYADDDGLVMKRV